MHDADEPNTGRGNLQRLESYYEGTVVSRYDKERETQASWHAESKAFNSFLDEIELSTGTKVLDVPIGTGRFIEQFAKRGYHVVGRDISSDMVATASERARASGLQDFDIRVGDGTNIDLESDSVELAVSVRFLVHLELSTVDKVLGELARVARSYVITHIRIESPGFANSLRRTINRALRKLRRASKKIVNKSATIHKADEIHGLFKRHGLQVIRDENVNKTGKGYESHLYLLRVA